MPPVSTITRSAYDVLERARQDAFSIIEADPTLAKHPDLARTIDRALDADREAFRGRG